MIIFKVFHNDGYLVKIFNTQKEAEHFCGWDLSCEDGSECRCPPFYLEIGDTEDGDK